jgi:RNA polymerase sigma-70 factor (ECF subfamily)
MSNNWFKLLKTMSQVLKQNFFNRYYKFVKHTCAQVLNCRYDCQDAAQEVMFNVLVRKKIISYRGDAAINTWLYRVSINMCKTFIRKKKRMLEHVMPDWQFLAERHPDYHLQENSVLHKLEKEQKQKEMMKRVNHLPEKYREAIQFYYLSTYSYKQSAQQLNITTSNFGIRLNRARKMLDEYSQAIHQEETADLVSAGRKVA